MYLLDLLGTLAFAISGATKAKSRMLNIFGVVFLGFITAVGGGTVRDLIIGRTPLFYLTDPSYIVIAFLGSLFAYFTPTFFKKRFTLFRFLDSLGLATFTIIGVSIPFEFLYNDINLMSAFACVFLGTITATGGGVLRDAVMGDVPFALKHGSNYITSAFLGSLTFFIAMQYDINFAVTSSMIITLILREIVSDFGVYKKIIKNKQKKRAGA